MPDVPVLFPKWQPQLTAAINETEPAKPLERVRDVEEILSKRLDRIVGSRSHSAQIQAIEQAMDALEILKRTAVNRRQRESVQNPSLSAENRHVPGVD
jgi:hypothetical protein